MQKKIRAKNSGKKFWQKSSAKFWQKIERKISALEPPFPILLSCVMLDETSELRERIQLANVQCSLRVHVTDIS